MRVLIVNTSERAGGAAVAARRLMEALNNSGVKAKMLVRDKETEHIAGMQEAGIIISINNDPDAPINKIADYVINGTVEEVVPKLIKYYKQNSK